MSYDPQKPFRDLYARYFPRVFAYVAYRVGNRHDTEDVVAEIFMRIADRLDQFEDRGTGSMDAWIFRIAQTQVAEFHRRSRPILSLDDLPDIESSSPSPEQMIAQKERFTRLRDVIRTLSPRRQEIVLLRFFGDLRNQEIATLLDLDERSVASHLSRALKDLQQKYDKLPEKEVG
jgi:RNA polymerase sigma-70 factor (ECF subfamily)